MFTRKQIEEIAAKLASMSIRDSQFIQVERPFDGTESVPILQTGENKRVSFTDMMNIIMGQESGVNLNIFCNLTVNCETEGAVIKINGQTRTNNTFRGYYGQIVLVEVSAEDYDTWYDIVTLTENCTVTVTLNSAYAPIEPTIPVYSVQVFNNQGADIKMSVNGGALTPIISGEIKQFNSGTHIDIVVSKTGYIQGGDSFILTEDYSETITLEEEPVTPEVQNKLYFDNSSGITIGANGGTANVTLVANIPWEIYADTVALPQSAASVDPVTNPPEQSRTATQTPTQDKYDNDGIRVGSTWELASGITNQYGSFHWEYSILQGNANIISINGNVLTATGTGATYITGVLIHDEKGYCVDTMMQKYVILPPEQQSDIPVESVSLHRNVLQFDTCWYNIESLYATVYPANAVSSDIIWESSDTDVAKVEYSGGNPTRGIVSAVRLKAGTCTITARSAVDPTKFDTCRVVITDAGTVVEEVSPRSISVPATQTETDVISITTSVLGRRTSKWMMSQVYEGDGTDKIAWSGTPPCVLIDYYDSTTKEQYDHCRLRVFANTGPQRTFTVFFYGKDNGGNDAPESYRKVTITQAGV